MIDDPVASMTIVDTAVSAGNFTTLVNALQATNLDAVLTDESTDFTVFAPADDAFALIDEKTMSTLLANPDVFSSIILQHVVYGTKVDAVTASTLNVTSVETASMAMQPVTNNTMTDMLTFGGTNIVVKDIHTTNGIIHVIDAVIVGEVEIPAQKSLVEVAFANGSFTTLADALV